MMMESNKLMETLLEKRVSEKEKCSTTDAFSEEPSISIESEESKDCVLNRRKANMLIGKRLESCLTGSLREI